MKKTFSIVGLCLLFTFAMSCEDNVEEISNLVLESYKQTIYLDGNPIEVDFSKTSEGKLKADKKNHKLIKEFLKSNPNATFFTSPVDKNLYIFKSEKEFNNYLPKVNIHLLESKNQISHMREIIDDENNGGGGGNGNGSGSDSFFASLRVYEHTNYINQLDQIKTFFWYQSVNRPFSSLNTNNMNDKISSFILELGTATAPNSNIGAMATFYQHDFSGYTLKRYVNENQRTDFYSNLHNLDMTTSWLFWNDTWNDEISSYKLEYYIED